MSLFGQKRRPALFTYGSGSKGASSKGKAGVRSAAEQNVVAASHDNDSDEDVASPEGKPSTTSLRYAEREPLPPVASTSKIPAVVSSPRDSSSGSVVESLRLTGSARARMKQREGNDRQQTPLDSCNTKLGDVRSDACTSDGLGTRSSPRRSRTTTPLNASRSGSPGLQPEVAVQQRTLAPPPRPLDYIRKKRRTPLLSDSEDSELEALSSDYDGPSPQKKRPTSPSRSSSHPSDDNVKLQKRPSNTPASLALEAAFPTLSPRSPRPTEPSALPCTLAPPSPAQSDIHLPVTPFDDALDDLLGSGKGISVLNQRKPNRPGLHSRMSARSDLDTDTESMHASPRCTPSPSIRKRAISGSIDISSPAAFQEGSASPRRLSRSAAVSPRRALTATQSAPDILDTGSARLSIFKRQEPESHNGPQASGMAPSDLRSPSPPSRTMKRTYAQMRSIRQEEDITAPLTCINVSDATTGRALPFAVIERTQVGIRRVQVLESYAEMKKRLGSLSDAGDSTIEDQSMEDTLTASQAELAGVTDLRSAGENRRFGDELDYMLEGLHSEQPLGVQRSSAIEIIGKMSEPDFIRRLKACDYVETVYDSFRSVRAGEDDKILELAICLYLARLSKDRRCACMLLNKPLISGASSTPSPLGDLVHVIDIVLSSSLLALTSAGKGSTKCLSKSEKRQLSTLMGIGQAELGGSPTPQLSSCSLALQVLLDVVGHRLPEPHSACVLFKDSRLLESITGILHHSLPLHCDLPASPVIFCIDIILQILEGIASDVRQENTMRILEEQAITLADGLVRLFAASQTAACSSDMAVASSGIDLLIALLKFLVSVTNVSLIWLDCLVSSQTAIIPIIMQCIQAVGLPAEKSLALPNAALSSEAAGYTSLDHVSQGEATNSDVSNPHLLKFDLLCLCFGLLEGLVESDGRARIQLQQLHIAPSCGPSCQGVCQCSARRPALQTIAGLYSHLQVDAKLIEKQFLSKYCALTLIYGILGDAQSRALVYDTLSIEGSKACVRAFLDTIRDLTSLHKQANPGNDPLPSGELEQLTRFFEDCLAV